MISGGSATSFYKQGIAYQKQEQWSEAVATLKKAVELDNGKSHTFYKLDWRHRLAFTLEMLGNKTEAENVYREASQLDPHILRWLEYRRVSGGSTDNKRLESLWELIDGGISRQEEALELIQSAKNLPFHFSDKWWFNAYSSLYRRGWATAAYQTKVMAAEVLRKTFSTLQDSPDNLRLDYAAAYVDNHDYTTARSCLLKLLDSSDSKKRNEALEFNAGLSLLEGNLDEALKSWNQIGYSVEDEVYRTLVSGKRIAIVAPGNTGVPNGKEIDGFDLVVRTNFRSHDLIAQKSELIGHRTDICYFNGNFEPANRPEIVSEFKQRPLKYAVMRFQDDEAISTYSPILPVRVSRIFNAFYKMNTYAMPKIVFDLLRFGPSEIKIFNADFYLRNAKHYEGYLDYDMDLLLSFFGHDILRNFRLLKCFYEKKWIKVDHVLSEVFELSEEKVMQRIEVVLKQVLSKEKNPD